MLADISATSGGSAIAGSSFTLDEFGKATIWGPTDATSNLFLRTPDDTSLGVQEVTADPDYRLDTIEAASGIPASTVDAKGDLIAGTANDVVSRLAAGANDTVLTADSAQATGLKWAAPAAHPNLAAHDALGLATDAELTTHAAAADPHGGYVLESLLDAKGDLIAASADNTPAKVTAGTNGFVLSTDSAQAAGVKWAPVVANGPSALQLGTSTWREPFPRHIGGTSLTPTSGVMTVIGIPLYAGDAVGSVWFLANGGLTMGTDGGTGHIWSALYDSGRTFMVQSTDGGGADTWGAGSWKQFTFTAAQTISTTGLYYVGLMVNIGTGGAPVLPTLRGATLGAGAIAGGPTGAKQLSGTNGSALAATAPSGTITITSAANAPYFITNP